MHVIFFLDLIKNGRLVHDNIHVHVKFFFDPAIFGRLGGCPKNDLKSHFCHVIDCFSEMPGPISFKVGMLVVHVGLLMHTIFVRDSIQNGRHFSSKRA